MTALLLLIVAMLLQVFWGGYVISILWAWFVVPLGVTQIGVLHAAGLSAVFGLFMGARGRKPKADIGDAASEFGEAVAFAVLSPLLYLAVGWAIHTGM